MASAVVPLAGPWKDETTLLDDIASDFPVGVHVLMHPAFSANGINGIDLMDAKLDPDVGGALLPPVSRCLGDQTLPVATLRASHVHGILDRLLPLFSSYLHGNAAISTVGTCLYTHTAALASMSAALSECGLPGYSPSAGPTSDTIPIGHRVMTGTPPPVVETVHLPGIEPGTAAPVMAQTLYISIVATLRLCALVHETIAGNAPFRDEDHTTNAWACGKLDLAWGMKDEEVLRGLATVEARLTGSAQGALEPHTEACVLHLQLLRHLLNGYSRIHHSSAQPPRKPFRWGAVYDLSGMGLAMSAAHGVLGKLRGAHDEAGAEAAPGIDARYERTLNAPVRPRFMPLPSFSEAVASMLRHCANATYVAHLPALASYSPLRGVAELRHPARDAPGMPQAPAHWPASQVSGLRAGDAGVQATSTVHASVIAGIGARVKAKEPLVNVPFSGITDPPLRWPDPLGVPTVCLTRHRFLPPSEATQDAPALNVRPTFDKVAVPVGVPDFLPYDHESAFDPFLVSRARHHVSLRSLWSVLEELNCRERRTDALVRAWAMMVTFAAPTIEQENALPAVLRQNGLAFDSCDVLREITSLHSNGTPAGPEWSGVEFAPDWAQGVDGYRGAHVASSVILGTHTLYEVIATELTDCGVPAELLWSGEGRAFTTLAAGVMNVLIGGLAWWNRTAFRRKISDEFKHLSILLIDAKFYDRTFADAMDEHNRLHRFIAARTPAPLTHSSSTPLSHMSELMTPFGTAVGPGFTDCPAIPDVGLTLPTHPVSGLAALAGGDMGMGEALSLACLPAVECADPASMKCARWATDCRLRRTLGALYGSDGVTRSLLTCWARGYTARLCRLHHEEGAAQGLYHGEEALAVQWWAECFAVNAVQSVGESTVSRTMAEQWPELRCLSAESLYCARTGAVHVLRRPVDPHALTLLGEVKRRCAEEVEREPAEEALNKEEESRALDVEEGLGLSIKRVGAGRATKAGKSRAQDGQQLAQAEKPYVLAKAYLLGCNARQDRMRDMDAIVEGAAIHHAMVSAKTLVGRAGAGPGRREAGIAVARYYLHRATARLLLAGQMAGSMKLLQTQPVAAARIDEEEGVCTAGGTKWLPPGVRDAEADVVRLSGPSTTLPSSAYRHPGKAYAYRWRHYAVLNESVDAAQPPAQGHPLLASALFTWTQYCERVGQATTTAQGEEQGGGSGVGGSVGKVLREQLVEAAHLVEAAQIICKAVLKDATAAVGTAVQGGGSSTSSASAAAKTSLKATEALREPAPTPEEIDIRLRLGDLEVKGMMEEQASAGTVVTVGKKKGKGGKTGGAAGSGAGGPTGLDRFVSRLWSVQPEHQTCSAGELLWASMDAQLASSLLRTSVGLGVNTAKLSRSAQFLERAEAVASGSADAAAATPRDLTQLMHMEVGTEPLLPSIKLPHWV